MFGWTTRWGRALRDRVHQPLRARPVLGVVYRALVIVLGVLVVLLGVVLIPAPGPGWLVLFAGLGILATEFAWARRLLLFARDRVGAWTRWTLRQRPVVRALIGLGGLTVLAGLFLASLWLSGWTGFPFR